MKEKAKSWGRVTMAIVPVLMLLFQSFGMEVDPGALEAIVTGLIGSVVGIWGIWATARAEPMGKKKETKNV